jgi:serine phosphatase RsbU (regulator of sigma subunit)/anti-sigma regulatory factor (Ser/Thr protein kinase)/PAS domain-containing protein
MRTEDVLTAIATGMWRWDNASHTVSLDAEASRLLGLPEGACVVTPAEVRSRIHPVDWNEIDGIMRLALSEDTLAESRVRVMDETGHVVRTLRSRSKPYAWLDDTAGRIHELVGTLQEVGEPREGTPFTVDGTAIIGDWRRSREAFLLDAGRALAEARSTSEVLRVTASLSMPGFSPDGLAVFTTAGQRLKITNIHGHGGPDSNGFAGLQVDSDYPAAEVMRGGRAVYLPTPEVYRARYPAIWPAVEPFGRSSWAYLPLIVAGRTLGVWMAAFKNRVAFSPDERSVLTTVARMLAQALARTEVAESERELTQGLQRAMMPRLAPEIPGMSVAARYIPTGGGLEVGGDWYDMIPLPGGAAGDGSGGGGGGRNGGRPQGSGGGPAAQGGRFAMVIGDVQGHDVRAAGLMGQLRIALRAYAAEGHRPDAVLSRANRFLTGLQQHPIVGSDGLPDEEHLSGARFATCLYLEVDPATGTLDIARAGHPDPVIRMADGTAIIRQTAGGLPLGIDPDSDFPTTRLVLGHGELLMLCTDGLIETGGHDMFTGWDRLRPILEMDSSDYRMDKDALEKLADGLIQVVHGPTSHHTTGPLAERREDDIALLLLARGPAPASLSFSAPRQAALTVAQADPEHLADARHQLRALLHDWADGEQVDAAVLMVSEMVTNVLVHTDGDAAVTAETAGDPGSRKLRVEVADTSDELPHRRRPGELASSGRGLLLMEVLADRWGVDPSGDGKTIWFELDEQRPAPAAVLDAH